MLTQDLTEIAREVWKKWGKAPSELFNALTPAQFVYLFTKSETTGFDRVEEMVKHNRERGRRGLRPEIPSWL